MISYRRDIDGLRAIAVLCVIIYHAFPAMAPGGFIGVDIFFVISGFLISGIIFDRLDQDKFSYRDFYARRIRRIFPALIVVLAVCGIVGWFSMEPNDYATLGREIVSGSLFLTNFTLWREAGYFDAAAERKPLLHLWSLGIEEQFYLLWPVLVVLTWKSGKRFLVVLAGVAIASFLANMLTVHHHQVMAFYSPVSRFWEFMVGAGLAYLHLRHTRTLAGHQNVRSMIGVLLLVSGVVLLNRHSIFPGWHALLPTLGAVMVLSAPQAWFNRVVLTNPLLRAIGLVSYPLYLWHWPALYAVNNLGFGAGLGMTGARLAALAASLALSIATYRIAETPFRFGRLRKVAVIAGMAAMAMVMEGGGAIMLTDGFIYRVEPGIAAMMKTAVTYPATEWRDHKCYLAPEEGDSSFAAECAGQGFQPLVYVWGDSFGAALYPGLKAAQETHHFDLAQYTASACPPLVDDVIPLRPLCQDINNGNLHRIAQLKPQTVVLAGAWHQSAAVWNSIYTVEGYDIYKLRDTVQALRVIGVPRIVILGDTPQWLNVMPTMLDTCLKTLKTVGDNQYSSCGLDPVNHATEKAMKALAAELDVSYVSLYDAMCNEAGCLTLLNRNSVSTFDMGHLTPLASRYVLGLVEPQLVGP